MYEMDTFIVGHYNNSDIVKHVIIHCVKCLSS